MVLLKRLGIFAHLGTGRDGKATDRINASRIARCDEISERVVGLTRWLLVLLAEHMELSDDGGTLRVGVELDIIPHTVGRPETTDPTDAELLLLHDRLENLKRILVKLGGLGTNLRI